ncbi:NAD-dependent epimerase/dehydratase family protein [Streptacidiphilus albus]|uniref:NAD-dependent epimerase/dehydratase family protein n=1 Tax=Streptacidiphilus albus TaxID=105425 RepID=UPI00054BA903|nr:NAD-dependent epimerase/dehydratase family protein [Streptacidiphilus albus]
MDIVGNGFLARSLLPIADRHPDTVALAAGVSWADGTSEADFARESDLLRSVARNCVETGRRLLFFSTASSGMYGLGAGPAREDDPAAPPTPYGRHKLAMEEQLAESGADHLIIRLSHMVGPGQPSHQLIPVLVRQIGSGTVHIHRGATRDLIRADDAVLLIDRLLSLGLRRDTVNVACGHAASVELIINQLERMLGVRAHREYRTSGASTEVCVDRLRSLVPEVEGLGFGADYYRRALLAFPLEVARSGATTRPALKSALPV